MGDSANDYEKLFLLEVIVDSVTMCDSSLRVDKSVSDNFTDTCVMFQFLHYPPLVVCEGDFMVTGKQDISQVTFKSGKSCFFSLRTPRGPIKPVQFNVKVTVFKKLKEGILPDKLEIGKTNIDMTKEFTDLLSKNMDDNCDVLPLSMNKAGTFAFDQDKSGCIGNVKASLRISCFGKLIITQFSLSKEDEKAYLFKGTDVKQACEIMRPEKDEKKVSSYNHSSSVQKFDGGTKIPQEVQGGVASCPPGCGTMQSDGILRQNPMSASNYPGLDYGFQGGSGIPPEERCGRVNYPPTMPPHRTVRPNVISNYPGLDYGSHGFPQEVRGAGRSNCTPMCCCPCPAPPKVKDKCSQQRSPRRQQNTELSPGEVGIQDDQVIFQLPLKKPGDPQDKHTGSDVYYKLTSNEETRDCVNRQTVNIHSNELPGMAKKQAVGPVSGLPVDDQHDVFLLKIGKKCDNDKKRNLELELRTPKMKEPKPPSQEEGTQYLESDVPKPPKASRDKSARKKSKGGKGKGGKGKGGKGDKKGKKK